MNYYGQAETVARSLVDAFEREELPQALAQVFLRYRDDAPCRRWSWNNQLLVALQGYREARGFRQWEAVGRRVRAGEKAFYILVPLLPGRKSGEETPEGVGEAKEAKRAEEEAETASEDTPKSRSPYGFKSAAVFGYEQTEGEPLSEAENWATWIQSLPLAEVAKAWGLAVGVYAGGANRPLGYYERGVGIALGVANLATWAHELIHAADDRNQTLTERSSHWRSEAVAELGGAVLLECLGYREESDRGGCWRYLRCQAEKEGHDPLWVCSQVIDRVCRAVSRVLEEAERLSLDRLNTEGKERKEARIETTEEAKP